ASIRIALEASHDGFVRLVENRAQQTLGHDRGSADRLDHFIGGGGSPFDNQEEGLEQVGGGLDVHHRKNRRQVDQDVVVIALCGLQQLLHRRRAQDIRAVGRLDARCGGQEIELVLGVGDYEVVERRLVGD